MKRRNKKRSIGESPLFAKIFWGVVLALITVMTWSGVSHGQGAPPADPHRWRVLNDSTLVLINRNASADTFFMVTDSLGISYIQGGENGTVAFLDVLKILDFLLYTGGANFAAYDTADVPTDGQQFTWNTGNTMTWEDASGGVDSFGVFEETDGDDSTLWNVDGAVSIRPGNGITMTHGDSSTVDTVNISVVESELTLSNIGGSVTDDQVPDDITFSGTFQNMDIKGFVNVQGNINQLNQGNLFKVEWLQAYWDDSFNVSIPIHNSDGGVHTILDSTWFRCQGCSNTDSSWATDPGDGSFDSITIIDTDTMGIALHYSVVHKPQGHSDTAGVYKPYKTIITYTPYYYGSEDEDIHVAVSNNHGVSWGEQIDSVAPDVPGGFATIPNPIITADSLSNLPGFPTVNFLSDPDGFFDRQGRYWVAFRASYTSGTPNTEILIMGTDDMVVWDLPVRILDTAFYGTNGLNGLVSPAIIIGSDGRYKLYGFGVKEPNTVVHTLIIASLDRDSPDSLFTFDTAVSDLPIDFGFGDTGGGPASPDSTQRFWWHLDVVQRDGDELLGLITLSNTLSGSGTYGVIGRSYDGGLTWDEFTDSTFSWQNFQNPSDGFSNLRDGYRFSGYMVNTGYGEALLMFMPRSDSVANADERIHPDVTDGVANSWRMNRGLAIPNMPKTPYSVRDTFWIADWQTFGYRDTAQANGDVTLEFWENADGSGAPEDPGDKLRVVWWRMANTKFDVTDSPLIVTMRAVAPRDLHIDSAFTALRTSVGVQVEMDSIVFYGPDPNESVGLWGDSRTGFSRKGVTAEFASKISSSIISNGHSVDLDYRAGDDIVAVFWMHSNGLFNGPGIWTQLQYFGMRCWSIFPTPDMGE